MSDTEPEPARDLSVADMRKVMSSILDVLECPVCYQELYSPIYQCNNGHPVCSSCRPRVRACPVCKSWMYHVRALTLEKIVRELPRPCRYTAGGCTERLGAATRAHHERCCPRRPARCVEALVPCGWKGPLPEARAHLWAEHELASRLHRAMHGRFSFSIGCSGQEKFLEDTAGSVLFRCLIRAERGRLHFLCHALVAADRADSYAFRVLVTNRCSERRLSYEGPVPSVFQSVSKTIEASQGLRVGRDWLLKACSCRGGELCFDTTWQLSRRAELAQTERDLRSILAGAYPEPHGGCHDRATSLTPVRRRPEPRFFTPSAGRQRALSATPNIGRPEASRHGRDATPDESPAVGRRERSGDGREQSDVLQDSREESNTDAGERPSSPTLAGRLEEPSALTGAPEGNPAASNGTPARETRVPSSSPDEESDASLSKEHTEQTDEQDDRHTAETLLSASDHVPPTSDAPAVSAQSVSAAVASATTTVSAAAQSPAAHRPVSLSEVSAACYAAAVSRLASANASSQANTVSETASAGPPEKHAKPETCRADASPETFTSESDAGPETGASPADDHTEKDDDPQTAPETVVTLTEAAPETAAAPFETTPSKTTSKSVAAPSEEAPESAAAQPETAPEKTTFTRDALATTDSPLEVDISP